MKAKTKAWVIVAITVVPLLALLLGFVVMPTPRAQTEFDRQEALRPAQDAERAQERARAREERAQREEQEAAQRAQESEAREASERGAREADGLEPEDNMINDDWRELQEWHDADQGTRNLVIHRRLERMIMQGHVRRSRVNKSAMYECMAGRDTPRNRESTIADVMYWCAERNGWMTTPSGHF